MVVRAPIWEVLSCATCDELNPAMAVRLKARSWVSYSAASWVLDSTPTWVDCMAANWVVLRLVTMVPAKPGRLVVVRLANCVGVILAHWVEVR